MRAGGVPDPEPRGILVQNMDVDGDVLWVLDRGCVRQQGDATGAKVIRNA